MRPVLSQTGGTPMRNPRLVAHKRGLLILPLAAILSGCATLGSMMSPYPEKFSCKNDDHGQCIHPAQAYEDAVDGAAPRSDPKVTADKSLLGRPDGAGAAPRKARRPGEPNAYVTYRESVYRELKGLIDAPVTPMLKPAQTVRTLILPYADRQRPDRLYMDRFVYSVIDRPIWVVSGGPGAPSRQPSAGHVLEQVRSNEANQENRTAAPAREVEP